MSGITFTKASGVNNSVFGKSQEPIKSLIIQGIEAFEKQSLLSKIFYMDTSDNFAEKYSTMTALGDFEDVGENGATPDSEFQEGFCKVIEPRTWKNRFSVSQEMVEDSKNGNIRNAAKRFTGSYNRTREKFGAALLANGHKKTMKFGKNTYNITCADNTPMFNAAHPSATQGKAYTQSNLFKNAFSLAVMDKMQEKMQDFADDDGNILTVMPDTIVIPNDAELKREILAAIGSDKDPDSADNAMNFQCGQWNLLVWGYLPKRINGEPYFFMMDSQYMQDYECMPWVDRVKLKVTSYIDNNTDANVHKGRSRFGAGFNNWRGIAMCGAGLTDGTDLTA